MSERLLRFARNDNVQCIIKVHGRCHCEWHFPKQSPHFHKGNLVAAALRYELYDRIGFFIMLFSLPPPSLRLYQEREKDVYFAHGFVALGVSKTRQHYSSAERYEQIVQRPQGQRLDNTGKECGN
ncbi:MAG: hypothetical protein HCAMLNBO_01337 [Candidatus Brocadia fulgida]|nr:hypothetical protein [Candidatus Brocadia fulgida]